MGEKGPWVSTVQACGRNKVHDLGRVELIDNVVSDGTYDAQTLEHCIDRGNVAGIGVVSGVIIEVDEEVGPMYRHICPCHSG